jgi:hypothetical protein
MLFVLQQEFHLTYVDILFNYFYLNIEFLIILIDIMYNLILILIIDIFFVKDTNLISQIYMMLHHLINLKLY